MLTLDLRAEPRWLDLGHGVRLRLAPLTTALMVAARSDAAVEVLPETASDEERAIALAKASARSSSEAVSGSASTAGSLRAATISAVVSGAARRRTPWPRSSQRGSAVRSNLSIHVSFRFGSVGSKAGGANMHPPRAHLGIRLPVTRLR